jgi:hypothetical protein
MLSQVNSKALHPGLAQFLPQKHARRIARTSSQFAVTDAITTAAIGKRSA